ncbi:hypothetical protein EG831_02835 [bacterium]|nr:hypothetical protein [bacterium]
MGGIERHAASALLAALALGIACTRGPAPGAGPATDRSAGALPYRYAVPAGDSIGFYRSPAAADTSLISFVKSDRLPKGYLLLDGCSAAAYHGTDGPWVRKPSVRPYYPAGSAYDKAVEPAVLNARYPTVGFSLGDPLAVYRDSALRGEPVLCATKEPFNITRRRKEGYRHAADSSSMPTYYEVFFVENVSAGRGVSGWVRAEQVIKWDVVDEIGDIHVFKGTIGIRYDEPSGTYVPLTHTWLLTHHGLLTPGECPGLWSSPDSNYLMVLRNGFDDENRTLIIDRTGATVHQMSRKCTSPAWFGSICLVRGMYDDDAVYAIDLGKKTCTSFFQIPDQYAKRQPDYGSGDGYYAHPAAVIDAAKKTVTIRFDRHRENPATRDPDYDSYLLATTDLTGKLLTIEEKTDASQ